MSEPARKPHPLPYDRDFFAWSVEQGRLLKARSATGLDWDNLAEEIESLGKSQRSDIRSRLIVLLVHLLKWEHQEAKRKNGWRGSILEARRRINWELTESPSLKAYPGTVLEDQYEVARLKAAGETNLPLEAFPATCPYSVADVLDEAFFPGGDRQVG